MAIFFILQQTHTLLPVYVSWRISAIAKKTKFGNIDAREMESGLLDGREDDEHNDVNFVEMPKIFEMHDIIFRRDYNI